MRRYRYNLNGCSLSLTVQRPCMDWLWVFLSGDSDYVDDKSLAEAEKLKDQRARALAIKEQAEATAREQAALQNRENIAILKTKIETGEISTVIWPQVQARHIEGTQEFERYKTQRQEKGQTPQSILTGTTEEAQTLVSNYACTGQVDVHRKKDGTVKIIEYCDAEQVVGLHYGDNEYHDTKCFGIYYSKKGAHVVPTPPKGGK